MNKNIENHSENKIMTRFCAVCGTKIIVHRLPNRRYKGGNYFGRVGKGKKRFEYWECDKCFRE